MEDKEGKGRQEQICMPSGESCVCIRFKDYLTAEEEEILAEMRDLKGRVNEIKARMNALASMLDPGKGNRPSSPTRADGKMIKGPPGELWQEWLRCRKQLEDMRKLWKELEKRREEAHHRKMVMLGHRSP